MDFYVFVCDFSWVLVIFADFPAISMDTNAIKLVALMYNLPVNKWKEAHDWLSSATNKSQN